MRNFFGYGNWNSDLWFLGIEEGNKNHKDLLFANRKIKVFWDNGYDHSNLPDNYLFQVIQMSAPLNINEVPLFGNKPSIQPTWNALAKLFLGVHENNPQMPARSFRGLHLGRKTESYQRSSTFPRELNVHLHNHAIVELLPLPIKNISDHSFRETYGSWTKEFTGQHCIPLTDRQTYFDYIIEDRIETLSSKINQFQPRVIFIYNSLGQDHLDVIFGQNWEELKSDGLAFSFKKHDNTFVYKLRQPVSRGTTNNYYNGVIQHFLDNNSIL